jgi:hypothetical protein
MLSHVRPLITTAGVALALGGCGAAAPHRATVPPKPPGAGKAYAQAVRFSTCMRTHGVPGFPDPEISSSGNQVHLQIRLTPGTGGPSSPAFKNATEACHSLLPGAVEQRSASQIQARIGGFVSFAHCMHQHGVSAFPDPTDQGELSVQMVQDAGVDLAARSVQAAAYACAPASHGVLTHAIIAQALAQAGAS